MTYPAWQEHMHIYTDDHHMTSLSYFMIITPYRNTNGHTHTQHNTTDTCTNTHENRKAQLYLAQWVTMETFQSEPMGH